MLVALAAGWPTVRAQTPGSPPAPLRPYPDQVIDSVAAPPVIDGVRLALRKRLNVRDERDPQLGRAYSQATRIYSDEDSRDSVGVLVSIHRFEDAAVSERFARTAAGRGRARTARELRLGSFAFLSSGPSSQVRGAMGSAIMVSDGPWVVVVRVDALPRSSLAADAGREAWVIGAGEDILERLRGVGEDEGAPPYLRLFLVTSFSADTIYYRAQVSGQWMEHDVPPGAFRFHTEPTAAPETDPALSVRFDQALDSHRRYTLRHRPFPDSGYTVTRSIFGRVVPVRDVTSRRLVLNEWRDEVDPKKIARRQQAADTAAPVYAFVDGGLTSEDETAGAHPELLSVELMPASRAAELWSRLRARTEARLDQIRRGTHGLHPAAAADLARRLEEVSRRYGLPR